MSTPLRVLTWHIHGNYLLYLSQGNVEFLLPTKTGRAEGYGGRGNVFPFGPNVRDIPADAVRREKFDCVLFQSRRNYLIDQEEILSAEQRRLPRIYLEHDPPLEHPTDTRHIVDDPGMLLVHVTAFNAMMWDSGRTPTKHIDHGVFVPESARYTGEIERGIVVVNHLRQRGRRLGVDIFERLRERVPLDLVGMDAESLGGIGEVAPPELAAFESRYRFFFHPLRYTSLGLALLEAMMLGMPVVGLATTELVTVIDNGQSGFIETDLDKLEEPMHFLLQHPEEARLIGAEGRRVVEERFSIDRFAHEWEETFSAVTGKPISRGSAGGLRAPARSRLPAALVKG